MDELDDKMESLATYPTVEKFFGEIHLISLSCPWIH